MSASSFLRTGSAPADQLPASKSATVLTTVVGVLIEVPVLPLVVRIVNRRDGWYGAVPALAAAAVT